MNPRQAISGLADTQVCPISEEKQQDFIALMQACIFEAYTKKTEKYNAESRRNYYQRFGEVLSVRFERFIDFNYGPVNLYAALDIELHEAIVRFNKLRLEFKIQNLIEGVTLTKWHKSSGYTDLICARNRMYIKTHEYNNFQKKWSICYEKEAQMLFFENENRGITFLYDQQRWKRFKITPLNEYLYYDLEDQVDAADTFNEYYYKAICADFK